MNTLLLKRTTLLFSLMGLAVSCNEKVAPALEDGNASTTVGNNIVPSEYYFRLVNSSPLLLNYKLHRTGSGRASTECSIKRSSALSNDLYRSESAVAHDSKEFDITCYLDAEELSLYHSGFAYTIEASANTCEFVGYSPFSFYDRVAGDSSTTFTEVACTGSATNAIAYSEGSPQYGAGPSQANCNQLVDTTLAVADRTAITIEKDEDLCRFNYTDSDREISGGGEKCDVGVITVNTMTVDYTPATASSAAITKTTWSKRSVKCGGKAANCVKGAIRDFPTFDNQTWGTEIGSATLNQAYSSTRTHKGLIDTRRYSNRQYANYRRHLASPQIDFVDNDDTDYASSFADPVYAKAYDPTLIDLYSNNKKMDGTAIISAAQLTTESRKNGYVSRPLAIEPFIGIGNNYRTNPFYTFYCLDSAYDVKARIRMVVRDWDRIFPTGDTVEYISDVFNGTSARQDILSEVEIPGGQDTWYNYFNDRGDWDDLIPMSRTQGAYNASTSIWNPTPTVSYPLGFFNPDNFPNGNY